MSGSSSSRVHGCELREIWQWNRERNGSSIRSFAKVMALSGLITGDVAYFGSCYVWIDFGTSAKPVPETTIAANNDPSREYPQNAAPVAGHEAPSASSQQPEQEAGPSTMLLEHDLNSERRKRRRTDQDIPIGNGAEPHEDYGVAERSVPTNEHVLFANPAEWQLPVASIENTAVQLPPVYGPMPGFAGTDAMPPNSSTPEKQYPERQKTLKLNPNGKLIQSPVGKQSEEQESKKQDKGSKRGRKPKKENTKVLIIKYASDDSTRERLGKAIADIISGRTSSKFRPIAPKPNPSPAPSHQTQTPKATHPFFLKKPAQKSDTPGSIQSVEDVTPNQTAADTNQPSVAKESSNLGSSGRIATPFSTFKPRPKFPELIYPLWPPRDFVHVRSVETVFDSQQKGPIDSLERKKAKGAVVRVHDHENVLSSAYGRPVNKEISRALRIPGRYVASGQTLRKAIASQLSNFSTQRADLPRRAIHPAIAHVDSHLATSMSAFDTGTCESCLWTQKYAPDCAEKVLQSGREAHMLRDWLRFLIISAVDTGKTPKESEKAKQKAEEKKRAKKRQKADRLEGFIVSSEDEASEMGELDDSEEDELAGGVTVSSKRTVIRSGDLAASSKPERGRMTNAILLSGPPGSGKTASVYAVAKELDFEVFEINPGSRRNNRDIVERVGDMTRNHLVHKMNVGEEGSAQQSRDTSEEIGQEDGKQNKLMSFFKQRPTSSNAVPENKPARKEAEQESETKASRPQRQSLILLEEADILFEEDRQFWSGVMTLIQHSRRPIIITCNDENLIPMENISLHAILRYRALPHDLAVDYLLLVAANEGHILQRTVVSDLYKAAGNDLRKTLMDLNFWCQMAIGSQKSGLDWMLDRWPVGIDLDQNGDPLRVLSLNTYQHYMGWFNRDMLLDNKMDSEVEAQKESLEWWQLSIQDSEAMNFSGSLSARAFHPVTSRHEQIEQLRYESEYAEMRSALDVLCNGCPVDPKLVSFFPPYYTIGSFVELTFCRMLLIPPCHQCLRNTG